VVAHGEEEKLKIYLLITNLASVTQLVRREEDYLPI
jgi:hypothetical protein